MIRNKIAVAQACLLVLAASLRAAPEDAQLAEQFNRAAASFAAVPGGVPAAMALADSAEKLVGGDLRLLRQAIDVRLSLGQRDKAIDLLAQYRKLDIDDELAQVQYIDLLTGRMQSADERANYLKRVISAASVPATVRGHASVQLCDLLRERGDDTDADAALDQALQLSPVNPKALQQALNRALSGGAAPKRVAAAVALLNSNPMQPATLALVAEELARAGAVNESADTYKKVFDLAQSLNYAPAAGDAVNAAAVWFAAGKIDDARAAADIATKVDPTLARAWFMKQLLARQADPNAKLDAARDALIRNVMYLHSVAAGQKNFDPATSPALPDVVKDVADLKAKNNGQLAEAYADALGDLAWLNAYFSNEPPAPAVMTALNALMGESSTLVTRIEGFAALSAGNVDAAEVKFKAIADRDALARLGLLRLKLDAGGDKKEIADSASKLLADLPVDVWSAMVRAQTAAAGPISQRTPEVDAVIAEAAKLDDAWLKFPQRGTSYYFANVRAVSAGVRLGEPALLTITLQNSGQRPLVIGPGGVIDQTVAVDAAVRGTADQQFPGAATARFTRKLILGPGESTTATARIDGGDVGAILNAAPQVGLSMFASAVTNPRRVQNGTAPGPGGTREQSADVINRRAELFSRPDVRAAMEKELASGDAVVRVRALRAVGANLVAMRDVAQPDAAAQQAMTDAAGILQNAAASDAAAGVRTAALQLLAIAAPEAQRSAAVAALAASRDADARTLACLFAARFAKADRQALLAPLLADADDAVKRFAVAVMALPDTAAATQPAAVN